MKSKNILLICLSAILISAITNTEAQSSHNSVRLALWMGLDIPDSYLSRVKNAGYTHVLCGFGVEFLDQDNNGVNDEWMNGEYTGTIFRNRIRDAFLSVHNAGLSMIPMFGSGNRHSGHFRNTNNPNIDWCFYYATDLEAKAKNKIIDDNLGIIADLPFLQKSPEYTKIDNIDVLAQRSSLCHAFAPDPAGIDKSIRSLLEVIGHAYEDAYQLSVTAGNTMPRYLDYIHIGHDEPITFEAGVDKKHQLLVGSAQIDRKWIYENVPGHGGIIYYAPPPADCKCFDTQGSIIPCVPNANNIIVCKNYPGQGPFYPPDLVGYGGFPTNFALESLFADELRRRVEQIEQVPIAGAKIFANTQVLVYADIWDPEHFGGYFGLTAAIDKLPTRMRNKIIFMPWQYDGCRLNPSPNISFPGKSNLAIIDGQANHISVDLSVNLDATGSMYNPLSAFEHFVSKGYRVIWTWAYPNGDPFIEADNLNLLFKFERASRFSNPDFVIGYCAAAWEETKEFRNKWEYSTGWNSGLVDPLGNVLLYSQSSKYNALELLANISQKGYSVFPAAGLGTHNSTFHGYLISIPQFAQPPRPTFLIDQLEVTKLDYLLRNRNLMFSDCDQIDLAKDEISYNDAILYCRNLSIREYLYQPNIPIVFPVMYGTPVTRGDLSNSSFKNMVKEWKTGLSNGVYRLPTAEELAFAISRGLVKKQNPNQPEWISVKDPGGMAWSYANGRVRSHDPTSTNEGCTFRVVRTLGTAATVHTIRLANKDWLSIDKFEYFNGTSWVLVEANDSRIQYVGAHWNAGACNNSRTGWEDEAETGPSYVEFSFLGTGIRVFTGEIQYQLADVYIDNVFQRTIVPSEDGCNNKSFEKLGL